MIDSVEIFKSLIYDGRYTFGITMWHIIIFMAILMTFLLTRKKLRQELGSFLDVMSIAAENVYIKTVNLILTEDANLGEINEKVNKIVDDTVIGELEKIMKESNESD